VRSSVRVCRISSNSKVLFAARPARGTAWPGVVVRKEGKGRVVYVSGWSTDFGFSRLVRRALYWATQRERDADQLSIDGRDPAFVYAYPAARIVALFSAASGREEVLVRCRPDVFGLAPDASARLIDLVTGECVFRGSASEMGKGFKVALVPSCVRLLALK